MTDEHREAIGASVRAAFRRDPERWRKSDEHRERIRRANRLYGKLARLARLILAELD